MIHSISITPNFTTLISSGKKKFLFLKSDEINKFRALDTAILKEYKRNAKQPFTPREILVEIIYVERIQTFFNEFFNDHRIIGIRVLHQNF